jgi:hypothetical protein
MPPLIPPPPMPMLRPMPPIPFMPTIPYKNKCEVTAEDIAVLLFHYKL